jgi:hypothetical protein
MLIFDQARKFYSNTSKSKAHSNKKNAFEFYVTGVLLKNSNQFKIKTKIKYFDKTVREMST